MTFIDPLQWENHRDTERAQSQLPRQNHEDTKTRRHHEAPSIVQRGPGRRTAAEPLGRTTAPNASVRCSGSTQRHALSESACLASHVDQRFAFEQARPRRNQRALGALAGVKPGGYERLRSEQTGFAPGAGDNQIAGNSAAPLRATSPTQVSLLCVLCVFVVATILSVLSVSLCLCGLSGAMLESTFNAKSAGRSGAASSFKTR